MPDIALSGVAVGCIYGLVGIGFCVIYNASGIVNFAQGVFVMLGGMFAHTLLTRLGLPMLAAALISIMLVALVGVLVQVLVINPMWQRKEPLFAIILATLAVLDVGPLAVTCHMGLVILVLRETSDKT